CRGQGCDHQRRLRSRIRSAADAAGDPAAGAGSAGAQTDPKRFFGRRHHPGGRPTPIRRVAVHKTGSGGTAGTGDGREMTSNSVKTALLLGLMSVLLVLGGSALGGRNGLWFGLVFAVAMNFFSYFFSDKIALSMYSAQPVSETQNPEAYRRVGPIVS